MSGSPTILTPKLIRNALSAYRKDKVVMLPTPCLNRNHNSNAILDQGLKALKQTDPTAAALLARRYLKGQTAQQMADHTDYSVDNYNKVQRSAIQQLVKTIATLEQAAYDNLRTQTLATAPIPGDLRLLGTVGTAHHITSTLCDPTTPSLFAIQGVGGIGKTSLAFDVMLQPEIVSSFKVEFVACNVGVSAETILPYIINELATKPHINCQGNSAASTGSGQAEKQRFVQHKLKTIPHLIVIDNLESLAVVNALLKQLPAFSGASRFLLTTREFEPVANVRSHRMKPLNRQTSITLMQRIAHEQALVLTDPDLLALHKQIGGNPYAMELVIPLLKSLPLQVVLSDLSAASLNKTQELYDHIFTRVWDMLSERQQQFLLPLSYQGSNGISADALLAMSGLPESDFWNCVQALTNRSLINPIRNASGQRFGLHRLLVSFLNTKVLAEPQA